MKDSTYSYLKFVLAFIGIILLALVVYVAAFWFHRKEAALQLAERARNLENEIYQKQLADTYGGKTPQETLQMYIDAVEKGDYGLASKYFVVEKQEGELNTLKNSPKANTANVIKFLKVSITSKGSYSSDGRDYTIDRPLTVDFVLYPNGIWKINEI